MYVSRWLLFACYDIVIVQAFNVFAGVDDITTDVGSMGSILANIRLCSFLKVRVDIT